MRSIFKGKKKGSGSESPVDANDLEIMEKDHSRNEKEEIHTELHLHPTWNISKEDQYVYRFLNNDCSPLKPNQISLTGIDIQENSDGSFVVTSFIRNSLSKSIKLDDTILLLIDNQGEIAGRKTFNLAAAGEIPSKSSMPWKFVFRKENLQVDSIPLDGWKLAFEIKKLNKEHALEFSDSWAESLADEEKNKFHDIFSKLNPPKQGEINFMGIQATVSDTGDLQIMMLIRNGSEESINLDTLPLIVEDATGTVIAKGGFKLEGFTVNANTSKPWNFIFPKSLVKEKMDLSSWKAYPPKN